MTHIQKSAPGPPAPMAVATPTMFPVPTVAASAVMSAWKWEMSPSPSGSRRFTSASQSACHRRRNCSPRSSKVYTRPVMRSRMMRGTPHTHA